jgi:hypothetical protein
MELLRLSNSKSARGGRIAGAVVALFFVAALAFPRAVCAAEVTVVYSGETHAMLSPCDCPGEPGGGLAERAAALSGFPGGARLLIDGGGFAGGGVYDTYSAGRVADSVRTLKALAAMGLMGYDAVGIGDDDLLFGGQWLVDAAKRSGVPLVSANLFRADGKPLAAPYIIVEKGGYVFAVTSVSAAERLFPVDSTVVVKDPAESLGKIRKEMKSRSKNGHLVLISHLGEEETGALLKKTDRFFLVANAHRKISVQPVVTMANNTSVMNFGFQGKQLSYAVLEWKNRVLGIVKSGWMDIDGGAGADPKVAEAVSGPKAPRAKAAASAVAPSQKPSRPAAPGQNISRMPDSNRVYDLYIMSLCPYGLRALGDLAELIRAFPQREWNVWFIGRAEGDKLSSQRGDAEMFDEALWLGVKALYPYRYHEFLFLRASSRARTEDLLNEMGLNAGKIRHWAEDIGPGELRQHYIRSMRLGVGTSPTLYVNNNIYDKPMGGGRLVREECDAAAGGKPDFCGDYPECFEDGDCRAVGKIGRCAGMDGSRAACEFSDDAAFAMKVLIADSTPDNPEKQIIAAMLDMLPGARVSVVRLSSEGGRRAMAKYSPTALPFFYFDKAVEGALRFSEVSKMLEGAGDGGYRFKKGAVRENYFPQRVEKPGTIALYADPLMPDIGKVISLLLSTPDLAKRVAIKPMVAGDPRAAGLSTQERLRNEEALRWIVIAKEFPKKYRAYLKVYGENAASSYWFRWPRKIGININRLLKRVDAGQPKLAAYWEDLEPVTAGEPVMVLINNRLKVTPSGETDLMRVLGAIKY